MPAFGADIDQMTTIAARLTGVVSSLQDEAHGSFDSAALGHPSAVSALESFVSNWAHGRSEISSGVQTVHDDLLNVAGGYTLVERVQTSAYMKAAGSS